MLYESALLIFVYFVLTFWGLKYQIIIEYLGLLKLKLINKILKNKTFKEWKN